MKYISFQFRHNQGMDSESVQSFFHIYQKISSQLGEEDVKKAVKLLKGILETGNEKLYVSFNGGKDATIVLFLTYFAQEELGIHESIKCLYFEETDPFTQMEQFMNHISSVLNLEIIRLSSKKYNEELQKLGRTREFQWIVMGSRKDDPGCHQLKQIIESDVHKGYPPFKRVCPIIDWSYERVWKFIKEYKIQYCKLYKEGYTSIGNKTNTKKNPHLYDKQKGYKEAGEGTGEIERVCREN